MANNNYATSNKLGVNITRRTTDPEHKLGDVVQLVSNVPGNIGKLAMYIKASGVIGNSNYATVALSSVSCLATSVDGGAGTAFFRCGSVAFADGEYGWLLCVKTAIPQGTNT
jgi:hypothetical protein